MTRYGCEIYVESEAGIPPPVTNLRFEIPSKGTIEFSNGDIGAADWPQTLRFRVMIDAPSIDEAEEPARTLLRHFLDALAYSTQLRLSIHRTARIIDWTPGLEMRDALIFSRMQHPGMRFCLIPPVVTSALAIHIAEKDPAVALALQYFRRGINDQTPQVQFQFFWMAVEVLAEHLKPADRVASTCQVCQGDLYCPKCDKVTTHRRFSGQAIRWLLSEARIEEAHDTFERLSLARHTFLHGGTEDQVVAAIGMHTGAAVNLAADSAWKCLELALCKTAKGVQDMVAPDDVSRVSANMIARLKIGARAGADPMNPKFDDFPVPEIKMEYLPVPDVDLKQPGDGA